MIADEDRVFRDVTASGVRLRVTERGDGPPVLFLHGLFVDHATWDPVVELLAERFRCICPDLPGFGLSAKPSPARFPYGIDAFAETIADLYAGLALPRAAVVGHGLGGAVALTVAARHAELVSKLVLVDSLCYETRPSVTLRLATIPILGDLVFKQLWGRTAFRGHFREQLLGGAPNVPWSRIDDYYDAFNSPAARGSALATLRSTADTRVVEARTLQIGTPTLVVWGRRDRLYPAGFGQRLAREIRYAGFELLDAGHMPQEERPSELADVVERFLDERRPSLF